MRVKSLLAIPADKAFLFFARREAKLRSARRNPTAPVPEGYGHVVLAPSTRGNLGDEAMLTASLHEIAQRSQSPVTLLTHSELDDWRDIAPAVKQVSIEGFFSATNFHRAIAVLADVLSMSQSFSILGADVMDGAYSRSRSLRRISMLEMATIMGIKSRVLGFSYSGHHNPVTHQYFMSISQDVTLYARDAKSYSRLRESARGKVTAVADTAFLLQKADNPTVAAAKGLQFISRMRKLGNRVIAFNANPLGTSMSSGASNASSSVHELDKLIANHLAAILEDQSSNSLILIPHDPREPHNDRALLQKAYDSLSSHQKDRIFCAFEGITARDVKLLCSQVDFAITGRMHMGIAALGAGCPTMFLDFQGKVQGLLDLFGVPELAFDWETYRCSEGFAEFVCPKLELAMGYRSKVKAAREDVIALAKLNFSEFGEG